MAARRPTNGRQVFVALDDVAPSLRERVALRLADGVAPYEAIELRAAAVAPRVRPNGKPYGAWVSKADAARVKRGLLPVATKPKAKGR